MQAWHNATIREKPIKPPVVIGAGEGIEVVILTLVGGIYIVFWEFIQGHAFSHRKFRKYRPKQMGADIGDAVAIADKGVSDAGAVVRLWIDAAGPDRDSVSGDPLLRVGAKSHGRMRHPTG